ncbi:MAG TPA: c-type cytochrome [Chitinophagaceae bacterium]|nr:c-type cytochrome [Chitinophagaceae bacterium]
MKLFRSSWFPALFGSIIFFLIVKDTRFAAPRKPAPHNTWVQGEWLPPDINLVPDNPEGELIRYGRELIVNTSKYFGPKGIVAPVTNGMNCQNCHVEAGLRPFGNSFAAVASTYPKFRDRSGKMENIEFRINECMERSLNGKSIDTKSREMKAMLAYFHWVGEGVPKNVKPAGSGIVELPFLARAADPEKGKRIYQSTCQRCHGSDGGGAMWPDSSGYIYPPLWGPNSYNVSAGLYRLSRLAAFIKYNMPYAATFGPPQLSDEEAWDVAAYISSQPRPEKKFPYDWPRIETKPVDYPFGPYADGFSEEQHKYGPFPPIRQAREKNLKR